MDPCTLVETGISHQLIILSISTVFIVLSLLLFRQKTALLVAAMLIGGSLFMPALTLQASAQSAPNECIQNDSGSPKDPNNPGVVLGLSDDFTIMQLPDASNSYSINYLAILSNDNPPDGDPYDWETIDLDVNTPGQQTSFIPTHPDDDSYHCGYVETRSFGILMIELNYSCYDDDSNTLPIPSDYTIAPFQYTVQTFGGNPAPEPATITITTQTNPIVSTVTADDDSFTACLIGSPSGYNILDNDSTTAGILDPLTIDLDLSKPGIQSSVSVDGYVISVNSLGELSVVAPPTAWEYDSITLYYTVTDSYGTVSNVAMIELGCPPFV